MPAPQVLLLSDTCRIAYHRMHAHADAATLPGIIFLGGFKSDMTGIKARWLEDWARARGRAFVRFDYRGHGASSGAFEEGCIGDWAADAEAVLDRLCTGPQILVGSSMGGWIALLLLRRQPGRVAGLVGLAAAPDFTEAAIWAGFDAAQRQTLARTGRIALPSAYSEAPYVITRRLIEDGRAHLVLRDPLPAPVPVRLLHGTADRDVAPDVALRLLGHLDGPDVRLTLVRGAGHRLSDPADLELIGQTVADVAS